MRRGRGKEREIERAREDPNRWQTGIREIYYRLNNILGPCLIAACDVLRRERTEFFSLGFFLLDFNNGRGKIGLEGRLSSEKMREKEKSRRVLKFWQKVQLNFANRSFGRFEMWRSIDRAESRFLSFLFSFHLETTNYVVERSFRFQTDGWLIKSWRTPNGPQINSLLLSLSLCCERALFTLPRSVINQRPVDKKEREKRLYVSLRIVTFATWLVLHREKKRERERERELCWSISGRSSFFVENLRDNSPFNPANRRFTLSSRHKFHLRPEQQNNRLRTDWLTVPSA